MKFQVSELHDKTPLIDSISVEGVISKKEAKKIIDSRLVLVNNKRVWIAKFLVKIGDVVEFHKIETEKKSTKIQILFQNKDLVIVNKPKGIVTNQAKGSLQEVLSKQLESNVFPGHRIDKDTTGIVIFAKSRVSEKKLFKLFKDRKIKKTYLTYVKGAFPVEVKSINKPLEGEVAITHIIKREIFSKNSETVSKLTINLETGRTHQIRKHLSMMGYPVVGDTVYGGNKVLALEKNIKGQLLHSWKVDFIWEGVKISVNAGDLEIV